MSVARLDTCSVQELGEAPHWDAQTQTLYFVDIFGKTIHAYKPATGEYSKASVGEEPVSLIIPIQGQKDRFVITAGRKLLNVKWDGKSDKICDVHLIAEVEMEGEARANRINDGKCDPAGRLWFGTMGPESSPGQVAKEKGSLYSMEPCGKVKWHADKIWIANGLAWNPAGRKMYYIDSLKYTIDEFDYDLATGNVSNRHSVFSLKRHGIEGTPDGMAVDTDGNLWVAVFEGHKVLKIDPRQPDMLLQSVELPARQVTSVAFGGAQLDELYVTTAKLPIGGMVLNAPAHGSLYKVEALGVKGFGGISAQVELNRVA